MATVAVVVTEIGPSCRTSTPDEGVGRERQIAGQDGGSAGVGGDALEDQRPGAEFGQTAVGRGEQGRVVQQGLGDRDGVGVGVDFRAAGLDEGGGQVADQDGVVGRRRQGCRR